MGGRREPQEYSAFELFEMARRGNVIALKVLKERMDTGSLTLEELGVSEERLRRIEIRAYKAQCLVYLRAIKQLELAKDARIALLVWQNVVDILQACPEITWSDLIPGLVQEDNEKGIT